MSLVFLLILTLSHAGWAAEPPAVIIGSKKFTESVILGELAAHLLQSSGTPTRHRRELGGTQILWHALRKGEIDIYPEYTGTLREEILSGVRHIGRDLTALRQVLARQGVQMSSPLGFNNTYALGMAEYQASILGIRSISDLRDHPELRLGFSNEFMDRADGWPGLKRHYDLPHRNVFGLDHDLAYRGLSSGRLDVTDLYTTDAEIQYYELRVLEDDRNYFPDYSAVFLYRADLAQQAPDAVAALKQLEGRLPEEAMITMNARARLDRVAEAQVAAEFLQERLGLAVRSKLEGISARLWRRTLEHLSLVGISLTAAILVAVPLGILAAYRPYLGQVILACAGILQTIPALALLVFMIPFLGIGGPPAIVALFLYSLLPILRNTYTGLRDIPRAIIESAEALGLTQGAQLRLVELPMASRSILAGIKTSAVINVGTATLGALIGAGGYGQPILTGIRLDDLGLILEGAIPAALLALLVQGLFDLAERHLVPKGLRLSTTPS